MNYFEFYGIPVSFVVDKGSLKREFYANSKKYHPDYFTLESEAKQAEVLELSTLNNQAYKTLSDFDRRMKYILDLKGAMEEEGKNILPQDFLMEMMDINESLMELESGFDQEVYDKVRADLKVLEDDLLDEVKPLIAEYDAQKGDSESILEGVKNFYLKKRYLLRIKENLSTFAPL